MVGLGESWCFCKGVSKSERTKAAIFSGKSSATVRISGTGNGTSGAGFLIHRNLLLTTHVNLPSASAAEIAEIRLQNGVAATLVPHRFFITSSVLDLTIVGLDSVDGDSSSQGQQHHYLKTCSKPSLDLGSSVYLLGYTDGEDLTVGEGKVVIATDNLIKLSADGATWSPGSAGFDVQGNLAFMICDPMKLATSSPTTNNKSASTSSSSSSSRKDVPMQFGIPIPIICDWLNQHWEGSLDDLAKPKLPIIRLMSAGPRGDHSCASFTLRRVFKSTVEDEKEADHHHHDHNHHHRPGPTSGDQTLTQTTDPHGTHVQGIPTPEIYESPKLNSVPVRGKTSGPAQLLDINFPPKTAKPARYLYPGSGENFVKEPGREEVGSTGSVDGPRSEVESSGSPVEVRPAQNGYSSEGETMYSAETAESRNYASPPEGRLRQAVGRSQSCVSYGRWGPPQRNNHHKGSLENQRSFVAGRKMMSSQGGAASQRSNDYYSPTVSSIMKKRNGSEPNTGNRPKQSSVLHSSPKWNF